MKALTICNPWAELIATGQKQIENRTWQTEYRGPLAIHAGKSIAHFGRETPTAFRLRYGVDLPTQEQCTFGAVIAVAELVDCISLGFAKIDQDFLSRWVVCHPFSEGPICWVLRSVRRLEKPIYCNGKLSIWECPLIHG